MNNLEEPRDEEIRLLGLIKNGKVSELLAILDRHPDWIGRQYERGNTLLHFASNGDNLSVIEYLLTRGADCNTANQHRQIPLHLACTEGHLPVIRALLAGGADANMMDFNKDTPLHYAAERGHIPVIEELLVGGADATVRNMQNETCLHVAMKEGYGGVVAAVKRYHERRVFMMFLSLYQFFQPPARFRRESDIEKVLVIEDLQRYLMSFI